jgi:hypothetical protein
MANKKCKICLIEKDINDFYNNKRIKDGKETRCKECTKEINKNNREKLKESQRRWREKNPDYMKNYGQSDKIKEYQKEYYQEHKEKYIKRKQEWRQKNPELAKEELRNYIENNREKVNEYHSNWKKQKREEDVTYKLKENMSRRVRYELNTLLKGKKTKRTVEYLGCSIGELKTYLESKFIENMSWDNYGEIWHIDHIIPCNAWDFSNEFENKCCWNYRNLQPLGCSENQSKKDKFNEQDKQMYIEEMKKILI